MTTKSVEVNITSWNAEYSKLSVTVVTTPLNCVKTFVRMNHTNNHYGQGYEWSWWIPTEEKYQVPVDKKGRDLLDDLVRQHPVLSKLASEYHIT